MSFLVVAQPTLASAQGLLLKVPMGMAKAPAGDLSVSPSPARFADVVAVGSPSAPLVLTVTNNGFSSIQNVVVGVPSGAEEFSQENTCASTLPGKSSCTISVTFKPNSAGERTGSVAVSSTASNGLQLVQASGLGVVPSAALAIDTFSPTQVNESSTAVATLTNSSSVALRLTPAAPGAPYSIDAGGTCGASVAAGASCTYKIKYAPTATGASTGSFKVGLAVGSFSFERSVALSSSAQAPAATLSIGAHGNVVAGSTKDVTGTLSNTGVGALTVGAPSVTGSGFSVAGTDCPASLPAGDTCGVTVRLTASGQIAHTGSLSVPTLAGTKTAPLSGQAQRAVLEFQPTSIDFGTKQTDASYQQTATLRNTGNISTGALTLSAPTGYSVSGSSCTAGLPAGGSCTVQVTFSPSNPTSYSGQVGASAATTSAQLDMSGTGQNASATIDALDFGNRAAGSTSTMDATLTNTGVGPLTLGSPSVSGAGFSIVAGGTCSTTLAAGASCKVRVQLTAAGTTLHTGNLSVPTTEAGSKSATLRGQSQQAIMGVTPLSRDFGNVQAGQSATSAAHTVSNTGNIALTGLTLTPPTGYSINAGTCSTSIAAGGSCQFTITFSPSAAQAYSGNVAVASSNAGTQNVAVTGSGQAQSATITDIAYGSRAAGASTDLDATLSNTGIGPLSITVPTAATVTGAGFSFVSTTCSSTLAASSSCTVKVRYTASGTSAASGSLVVSTGAGSKTSSLSGQSQQAIVGVSPASRAFGSVTVGQSSTSAVHTVSNSGNITATSVAISAPSGYAISNNTCSATIAAGASCTFTITFTPPAAQAYSGNVTVATANAGSPTVAVSGDGIHSVATLTSPSTVALADWYGSGTITGSFSYRNDGNTPMSLSSPSLSSPLSVAGNTCSSVAPGASCSITVALTRNANSGGSGSQSFTAAGANVAPGQSTVNWTIYSANPRWSSTSLSFGNVQVGQSSTRNITLFNDGSVAYNWASSNTVVNLPAGFSLNTSACTNVAPGGGSCTVGVTFSPSAAQAYSGSSITMASYSIAVNTFSVSGSGAAQSGTITNASFGNRAAGTSTDIDVTLTNTGIGPLSLPGGLSVSGAGFSYISSTCPNPVPASGSCTVKVRYTASGTAAASGTMTVPSGAGNLVSTLSGQSQEAVLTLSYPGHTLGVTTLVWGSTQVGQSAGSSTYTLTNTGNITATGVALSITAGWSISASTCTTTLAAGASCTFTTPFSPTAAQVYYGTLSVSGSGARSAGSYSLQGTGANPSAVAVGPTTYSYDVPQATGSGHRIAVQNNGSGPITINSLSQTVTQGTFGAWWAGAGGGAAGGYCHDGIVLQPGQNCGAWTHGDGAPGDVVRGTATINTSAGNFTFNATFTVRGLSYSGGSGSTISPTSGQTAGSVGTVTINNTTPFSFYFVNYTANGGGATRIGRFTGGNSGSFAVHDTNCPGTLTPGASCWVSYAAKSATSLGTYTSAFQPNGTFQQTGSGTNGSWSPGWWNPQTGTGTGDAWAAPTHPANFTVAGSTATLTSANSISLASWHGEGVKTGAFTYRNDGNANMTLNSPGLSAPLSVAGNTCSNIAPGASCTITVALSSTAAGNGGSSSQSFTPSGATSGPAGVTAYWSIYSAVPQWGATSLAFGSVMTGQSSTQNITLYNYGSVAYNWAANNSIANHPGGFSFDLSACGSVAPNGGSCNVRVTFSPSAAGGYGGGNIYPAWSSYVNNTLSVSGTGIAPALGTFAKVSSQNNESYQSGRAGGITISNTGSGTISGIVVSQSGSCSLQGNSSTLAPGAQMTVAFYKASLGTCTFTFTGSNVTNSGFQAQ